MISEMANIEWIALHKSFHLEMTNQCSYAVLLTQQFKIILNNNNYKNNNKVARFWCFVREEGVRTKFIFKTNSTQFLVS